MPDYPCTNNLESDGTAGEEPPAEIKRPNEILQERASVTDLDSGSGPVLFVGADGESHQVKVPIKGEHFLYPQPLTD